MHRQCQECTARRGDSAVTNIGTQKFPEAGFRTSNLLNSSWTFIRSPNRTGQLNCKIHNADVATARDCILSEQLCLHRRGEDA